MKKDILKSMAVFVACMLVSCSTDVDNTWQDDPTLEVTKSMKMNFCGNIITFDSKQGTTRADNSWTWKDGAVVYLQYYNGTSVVRGHAVYSSSTKSWEAYWSGTLGTFGKCEIYYFDGASTNDKHSVSLTASQAVYADKSGAYSVSGSEMLIQANLTPLTSRIRFAGKEGLSIFVKGITFYTGYNADSNELLTSANGLSCKVGSDDYTPYFYCVFSDNLRQLKIANSSDGYDWQFVKSFESSVLKIGESGYITIPQEETNKGWEMNRIEPTTEILCNDGKHPHTIDMGNGLKWSCCNVGAKSPIEYGDYFAWGETKTKTKYAWSNYSLCKGDSYSMTKYCDNGYQGTVDDKTLLELSDDAARVNWGIPWRMPIIGEFSTLINKCTWTWTTISGVKGYLVTASNNNLLFFPAAGYYADSSVSANSSGYYWSSSLGTKYSNDARSLYFYSYLYKTDDDDRYAGRSVRPVAE